MKPDQAIKKLREMQRQIVHGSNIFGEIADMLAEAKWLIEQHGTTGVDDPEVMRYAEKWLAGTLGKP